MGPLPQSSGQNRAVALILRRREVFTAYDARRSTRAFSIHSRKHRVRRHTDASVFDLQGRERDSLRELLREQPRQRICRSGAAIQGWLVPASFGRQRPPSNSFLCQDAASGGSTKRQAQAEIWPINRFLRQIQSSKVRQTRQAQAGSGRSTRSRPDPNHSKASSFPSDAGIGPLNSFVGEDQGSQGRPGPPNSIGI